MISITKANVKNKKVIVRVDYNVPMENDSILDDTRIVSSLKTINYLIEHDAKIILLSHLGRVEKEEDKEKLSLEIVAKHLSSLVKAPVYFIPQTRGEILEKTIDSMTSGEIVLVENTRFEDYPRKLESSCDEKLSKYWAGLADLYVLDAFGTAHRCHSSTYGISAYIPSYSGFLVDEEVEMLNKAINQNKTMILGGAKVEDKIGVIDNLINTSECILLGGGLCFTFLKAKGYNVGNSIVNEEKLNYAEKLLSKNENKIFLPIDVVTQNGVKSVDNILDDDIGYDIGPKTIEKYKDVLLKSKLIFWNGPLGKYEEKEYENGTKSIMKFLYDNKLTTILAGGDIIGASKKLNFDFKYVSTGGGSTLEYLEGKRFKTLERLKGDK